MPVSLVGQYSFDLKNTFSLPSAKLECKKIATKIGIEAHLMIMRPDMMEISDETINCIYENLLSIEVVDEIIDDNILFMRVISSTYSSLLEGCLP
tara:strand:- start:343 stop:627 length:285 start_codon:yes stop_codon:yes gene_type:complete